MAPLVDLDELLSFAFCSRPSSITIPFICFNLFIIFTLLLRYTNNIYSFVCMLYLPCVWSFRDMFLVTDHRKVNKRTSWRTQLISRSGNLPTKDKEGHYSDTSYSYMRMQRYLESVDDDEYRE